MKYRFFTLLLICISISWQANASVCANWPLWQDFTSRFISADGRVVDHSTAVKQSTSEGQSYALFFALVANDRRRFEQLLSWTNNNLADGDLSAKLPAWQWGQRHDGSWGILDDNAAADSDVWLAYVLTEAGRLWREPRYSATGKLLAARILREETADLPGLGRALLPGPKGFHPEPTLWRLNPSYVPLQLITRLSTIDPAWKTISATSLRLLLDTAPKGYAPDWVAWQTGRGWQTDPKGGNKGSYDAIRVYLWAGMLPSGAIGQKELLARLVPMAQRTAELGYPPRETDTIRGTTHGTGSTGFSAAILPLLASRRDTLTLDAQLTRLIAQPLDARPEAYYDHVLTLFGTGWHDGRFRFMPDGRLVAHWEKTCAP